MAVAPPAGHKMPTPPLTHWHYAPAAALNPPPPRPPWPAPRLLIIPPHPLPPALPAPGLPIAPLSLLDKPPVDAGWDSMLPPHVLDLYHLVLASTRSLHGALTSATAAAQVNSGDGACTAAALPPPGLAFLSQPGLAPAAAAAMLAGSGPRGGLDAALPSSLACLPGSSMQVAVASSSGGLNASAALGAPSLAQRGGGCPVQASQASQRCAPGLVAPGRPGASTASTPLGELAMHATAAQYAPGAGSVGSGPVAQPHAHVPAVAAAPHHLLLEPSPSFELTHEQAAHEQAAHEQAANQQAWEGGAGKAATAAPAGASKTAATAGICPGAVAVAPGSSAPEPFPGFVPSKPPTTLAPQDRGAGGGGADGLDLTAPPRPHSAPAPTAAGPLLVDPRMAVAAVASRPSQQQQLLPAGLQLAGSALQRGVLPLAAGGGGQQGASHSLQMQLYLQQQQQHVMLLMQQQAHAAEAEGGALLGGGQQQQQVRYSQGQPLQWNPQVQAQAQARMILQQQQAYAQPQQQQAYAQPPQQQAYAQPQQQQAYAQPQQHVGVRVSAAPHPAAAMIHKSAAQQQQQPLNPQAASADPRGQQQQQREDQENVQRRDNVAAAVEGQGGDPKMANWKKSRLSAVQ